MAFEKGEAGKSTTGLADKRYLAKVFVGLIGVFAIFFLVFISFTMKVKGIVALVLLGVIIIAMKIISRETDKGMTKKRTRQRDKIVIKMYHIAEGIADC